MNNNNFIICTINLRIWHEKSTNPGTREPRPRYFFPRPRRPRPRPRPRHFGKYRGIPARPRRGPRPRATLILLITIECFIKDHFLNSANIKI